MLANIKFDSLPVLAIWVYSPNCLWAYAIIKQPKICRHELTVRPVDASVFIGHCDTVYIPEQICISSSTWQTCIIKIGHLLYTNRHLLTYLLTRGNIVFQGIK